MSDEAKICSRGHRMSSKIGKDGKRHYFCQKCRNAAARQRRTGGGRRLQSAVSSISFSTGPFSLWGAVNGDYWRKDEAEQ